MQPLRAAVTAVASGTPRAVLVTGPPGVGKTRLAEEALALATGVGFATFRGRCRPLAREVAFAPLSEALGPWLRGLPEPRRRQLVGDLPQLGLVYGGLGLPPLPPLGDPELDRARLVDALARLLERVARDRPVGLLLDDVHAAGPTTAALVQYLVTDVVDRPILLLLTGRPDEPGRSGLADLRLGLTASSWPVDDLPLPPLAAPDARTLVQALLGRAADGRLVDRIVDRCAGRPLFLEATAQTLLEGGALTESAAAPAADELAGAVGAQLRARLAVVTPAERSVLELLAVAGSELAHAAVARAVDLDAGELVPALDRLYRRGLLVTGPDGAGHELAHELLRDVLVADLSPVAAQQAHARVVAALAAADPADPRIPEHILAAGPLVDPAHAFDHLLAGSAHAERLGATDEAARYLAAAVAVGRQAGRAAELAEPLVRLGRLADRLGDREQAASAWAEAATRYAAQGDPVGTARVDRELAMLAWRTGELAAARERFAAAERALSGLAAHPEQAELEYTRFLAASRIGDFDAVRTAAARLRSLARRLGSPSLTARALLAEAAVRFAETDYVRCEEINERALVAARESGDQELVARAHDQLSVTAATQGDLAALRRHSRASLDLLRDLGAGSLEGWPRVRLALADLLAGDWDAALRGTAEALTRARGLAGWRGEVGTLAAHAWVQVHRGRLAEAADLLREVDRRAEPSGAGGGDLSAVVAVAGGALALAEGRPDRAVAATERLDDLAGSWFPLLAGAIRGEALCRAGEPDAARSLAARLRDVVSCRTPLPGALADWLGGLAAAETRRIPEAAALLARAAAGFDGLGLPCHAARARLERARVLAGDEAPAAVEDARSALAVFDRLGSPIDARDARALLRRLGVVPSRGRARAAEGGPLSPRELEVARLVAAGLSNADVATRLFISPRTVTTHLERMYARLGLSSRVALTRYLTDSGLLEDDGGAQGIT